MTKLFFTSRFYIAIGLIVALFAFSFYVDYIFQLAQMLLLVVIVIAVADVYLLFSSSKFSCTRETGKVLSLSDENSIRLHVKNNFNFNTNIEIIDEVPYQFQMRDFSIKYKLKTNEEKIFKYKLTPKTRGLYTFNNTNILVSSPIKLAKRKLIFENSHNIPVYPSIIQMKKFTLQVNSAVKQFEGLKKIQRIGHSYEFDHIKNYVIGEDTRSLNWKASSRRNELMINHYEDEKSQQVYCILNKSRLMNMPFNGLSLLDYSINSTLAISNIVYGKSDRIGYLSFSDKIGNIIKASRSNSQLQKIMTALYNEKENNLDPNYELLYSAIRYFIPNRSLILLYTNFETADSLNRNLHLLRKINRFHLLVPIIFINSELDDFIQHTEIENDLDIYHKVIARKMQNEKEIICSELRNHGIQYILTKPEDLSINTINKYLELKSRGLI